MLLGKVYLFLAALLLLETSNATYTRVGNTYMKKPSTCCALDPLASRTDCAMTSLYATNRIQLSFSPGFPSRFPIGRACMWSVQCQPGYQVRLEFRDFYLIGPDSSGQCVDQYVRITSPITGHSMGRFCGNSGIPTIVSAGNLVIVQLQSEIPQSSENYRGFAFVFRETLEAPNPEMRPNDWINHGQYSLDLREIARRLRNLRPTDASAIPTTLRTPRKTKPTTTEIAIVSGNSLAPTWSPSIIRTNPDRAKPTVTNNRKRPTVRAPPFASTPRDRNRRPGKRPNIYGENDNREVNVINKKTTLDLPLSIEALVGIAAGGVCFILLCILIGCKIHQVRKKTRQNPGQRSQTQSTTAGQSVPMVDLTPTAAVTEKSDKNQVLPGSYQNAGFNPDNPSQSYLPGYYIPQEYPYPPAYSTMPGTSQTQSETTRTTPVTLPNAQFPHPGQYTTHPYSQQTGPMLLCDPTTGLYYHPNAFPVHPQPTAPANPLPDPSSRSDPQSTHFPIAAPEFGYRGSSLSSDEELSGQMQRYAPQRGRNSSRPAAQRKRRRNRKKRRR